VAQAPYQPETVQSLEVFFNATKVGMIVQTPGESNATSFEENYRATAGFLMLSLSFRAAYVGLRKDPRPVRRALPAYFANLPPEDEVRKAVEKYHAGTVLRTTTSTCWPAIPADFRVLQGRLAKHELCKQSP